MAEPHAHSQPIETYGRHAFLIFLFVFKAAFIPLLLSPFISRCFSIHSSPAIGFHSCFFFTTDVSASIRSTLHLLMVSFQAWDWLWHLMLGSQRRIIGCARSRNLVSNFCPGRGLNLGPHSLIWLRTLPLDYGALRQHTHAPHPRFKAFCLSVVCTKVAMCQPYISNKRSSSIGMQIYIYIYIYIYIIY